MTHVTYSVTKVPPVRTSIGNENLNKESIIVNQLPLASCIGQSTHHDPHKSQA